MSYAGTDKEQKALWECQCICGNKKIVTGKYLRHSKNPSCGCSVKMESKYENGNSKNLIGQKFGKLLVISKCEDNSGRFAWFCKCDCGNTTIVKTAQLVSGWTKSCGCYQKERVSELRTKDLVGEKFGLLTVLSKSDIRKRNSVTWKCKCECGAIKDICASDLLSGRTNSCGCMKSKIEYDTSKILSSNNIQYIREYSFPDLLSENNYPLRFDFAIFAEDNLKCLIECQGIQHFKNQANEFGLYQREISDSMKKEYCKNNGIKLFEIKYDDDIPVRISEILNDIQIA